MNKQSLSALAAMLLSMPILHAQQAVHTPPPNGLQRAMPVPARAGVRAILTKQIAQAPGSTAQKPTADERLIAIAYDEDGGTYYDSTTYQYSGTRGSNLTTSLFSYVDDYFPLNTLEPGPYEQITPTLLYDMATDYSPSGGGPMVGHQTARTYDAADRVTGLTQHSFDGFGTLTYQDSVTVAYNAGTDEIDEANDYSDTSMALTGMYALTSRLGTEYGAGLRTKDTSTYIFGSVNFISQANAYTYDGNNRLVMTMTRHFDSFSGIWEDVSRSNYTYDAAGRLTKHLYEELDGTTWAVNTLDTFGYTGSNPNYTFYQATYYDSPDTTISLSTAVLNSFGAWDTLYNYSVLDGMQELTEVYKLTYNSNTHLTHYTGYDSDGAPSAEARFYYEPVGGTGVADIRKAGAAFATIFPNPADNATTIGIANPQGRVSIAITNMAGQLLGQQSSPAAGSIALNTATLPAGSYYVTVTMNGAAQTLKLVKQ